MAEGVLGPRETYQCVHKLAWLQTSNASLSLNQRSFFWQRAVNEDPLSTFDAEDK